MQRRAGEFAQARFRVRRRVWRRRIVVPLVGTATVEAVVLVALGYLVQPSWLQVWIGFAAGMALTMIVAFEDSPPSHIERWREGADGERATAKALRPLVKSGWTLINDIDIGRGNLDHVLVGPAGVFVLDTKRLRGRLSVAEGVLSVRWIEDPEDGYENPRLAPCMRRRAVDLAERLGEEGVLGVWVQPVIVLWGAFEQRSWQSGYVGWVAGKHLASVLAARPRPLSDERVAEISAALVRSLSASGS